MRRHLSLLAVLCLVAAACGGEDSSSATSTTVERTTTTVPTTAATATTTPPCASVSLPGAATQATEALGDADGDGAADTFRGYLLGESDWHLQVALAAGGGADLAIVTFGGSSVAVLGGADVDGDGADELWARTGSGASATILGLARFSDCALTRVTFAGSEPAELPVGGSVGTASGIECEARVDPTADLTAYTASNVSDDRYEVTATEYALEGTKLIERAKQDTSARVGDDIFTRATSFTCDDVSL